MLYRRGQRYRKDGGFHVSDRDTRTPKERLVDEIEVFVRGRLTLIMLPVCARLKDEGRSEMVDAMGIALRDIRANVESILDSYGGDL